MSNCPLCNQPAKTDHDTTYCDNRNCSLWWVRLPVADWNRLASLEPTLQTLTDIVYAFDKYIASGSSTAFDKLQDAISDARAALEGEVRE